MTTTDRGPGAVLATVLRSVLAAVLGLALGGCGDGGADDDPPPRAGATDPADPAGGAERPDADFTASVQVVGDAVRVSWTLRNTTDGELLVVDGVPRVAGAGIRYDATLAYVSGRGSGVLLSQRAFPWPETDRKAWDQAPRVGVTRLAAGEELTRELSVAEPFVRRHPFGDDLGAGPVALPADPDAVTFCLGVIAPPYPPALGLVEEDEVTTIGHGNAAWDAQAQLCADPVALS